MLQQRIQDKEAHLVDQNRLITILETTNAHLNELNNSRKRDMQHDIAGREMKIRRTEIPQTVHQTERNTSPLIAGQFASVSCNSCLCCLFS